MPSVHGIKAVVFDLDGTAVASSRHAVPSPALVAAIAKAKPHLRLCSATGRSWDVGEEVLRALGLTDPCIISGGTMIVDPRTAEILWQATILPESARAVAGLMAKFGCELAYARRLEAIRHLDGFEPSQINVMYMLNIPVAQIGAITQALAEVSGITAAELASWDNPGTRDLHITSNIATKEHAVHELSRLIRIPATAMAGVGDGLNDLHLFNAVGHKIAMGNAVPPLQAAADEVIGSLDEDGLANYILSLC